MNTVRHDRRRDIYYKEGPVHVKSLNWIEVKYGEGTLSKNQKKILERPGIIPVSVFRVTGTDLDNIEVSYHPKYEKVEKNRRGHYVRPFHISKTRGDK